MHLEDYVHLFRKYLRSRSLHITQARERIAAEVFQMPGHFDATDLWGRLRGNRIAAATIYRTLELLAEAGLVRRWMVRDRMCYEESLSRPHHEHLMCRQCGRVLEFSDRILEERLAEVVEAHGFRHQAHQVLISGLCPDCLAPNSKPSDLGGSEARC
jgi:Fur family ferric uptake transcriptional regulator